MNQLTTFPNVHIPVESLGDMRTNHAGETGAVFIYRGMLAVTRDPHLRAFAQTHAETEQKHLTLIEACLPKEERSRLLTLWRMAGWMTGFISALAGPKTVYAAVASIETFVDEHYSAQIDRLRMDQSSPSLLGLLEYCREDEIDHRDQALDQLEGEPGRLVEAWCRIIRWGSAGAVAVARKI